MHVAKKVVGFTRCTVTSLTCNVPQLQSNGRIVIPVEHLECKVHSNLLQKLSRLFIRMNFYLAPHNNNKTLSKSTMRLSKIRIQ